MFAPYASPPQHNPLLQLIRQGEGQQLDFKKTISSAQKIAKSLVAFANTDGGRLLIGVRDNGTVCGCQHEEELHMIEGAASFFCRPEVPFSSRMHKAREGMVTEIYIPRSPDKPHYALSEDDRWLVYQRVGDQNQLASKTMLDIMRREAEADGAIIEFSHLEKALLHYLDQHPRITLKEYMKLVNISKRRANRIVVELAHAGMILVHTTEKDEYFSLRAAAL